jgi:hypothetical protein
MNLIKKMKRHPLETLIFFEQLYAQIEREALEGKDPRVNNPGGVSEQLQAIRDAIYELRVENGIPIPNNTVQCQTLVLEAKRGIDIKE